MLTAHDQSKRGFLKSGHEVNHDLVQGSGVGGGEHAISGDGVKERLLGSLHVGEELLLELGDPGGVNFVKEPPDTAIDDSDLILDRHGAILALNAKQHRIKSRKFVRMSFGDLMNIFLSHIIYQSINL